MHVTKVLEFHSQVLAKAKGNIVAAQCRQKEQYDKKHAGPTGITTGSTVLQNAKNKARKGWKQDPLWLGPYTVEQVNEKGVCKLRNRETGKLIGLTSYPTRAIRSGYTMIASVSSV